MTADGGRVILVLIDGLGYETTVRHCGTLEDVRQVAFYRAAFNHRQAGGPDSFTLAPDNSWSTKYFTLSTPETKARAVMAGTA